MSQYISVGVVMLNLLTKNGKLITQIKQVNPEDYASGVKS